MPADRDRGKVLEGAAYTDPYREVMLTLVAWPPAQAGGLLTEKCWLSLVGITEQATLFQPNPVVRGNRACKDVPDGIQ